ncbi:hypothetical protein ACVWWG_007047 [Bradyrhizobium sp. LB7.2]
MRSGPGYAKGVVDLDATPADNVRRLAKAKGVQPDGITVLVLDRPRHASIIESVRSTGAAVRLITDGDVAGVIHCADPDNTGVDMYLGTGGAPEGVLAAVALRCIGGQMQCRLILDSDEKRERAAKMGVNDPKMIYGIEDMARGDCLFAATGVTTGSLLSGVKFRKDGVIADRDGRDALRHRHRALHQGRAPRAGEVPPGLSHNVRPSFRACASRRPGMTKNKQYTGKRRCLTSPPSKPWCSTCSAPSWTGAPA